MIEKDEVVDANDDVDGDVDAGMHDATPDRPSVIYSGASNDSSGDYLSKP